MVKRKALMIAVAPAALVLGLAACGPHSTSSKPHATYTAPAAKASLEAQAEKCAQGANFLTKPGRQAYAKCVSPGDPQKVETCAEKNVVGVNLFTAAGRQDFINKVSNCA